nr:hypothetical protein [Tanacetum cinerariifolium]
MMIEGLDRNNEVIAKHLREYEQAAVYLSAEEKLELISKLVKYQDHRAKILKYQDQQSKPLLKKEKREFYIERVKRQGLKIDQGSSKRMKTSEDVSEEELKGMMQLVPLEEVYEQYRFIILQTVLDEELIEASSLDSTTFSLPLSFDPMIELLIGCEDPIVIPLGRLVYGVTTLAVGEGSGNPTEPHHTPSPQEHHSPQHYSTPPSPQTIISESLPQAPIETLTPKRYIRRAIRIAQSKALSPAVDECVSLPRDDRQGEAFPTVSSLDARQDRENIVKTSALPHESSPRATSLDADEGNQDLEISESKARVKFLDDKENRSAEPTQEDAPITGGIIEIGEELGADKCTELGSNDTEDMVNVLISIEAANILTSGGAAASVSLGITTTCPTPLWCGCGGHNMFGRHHSGGFRRLTTSRHYLGLRHHSPTPQGAVVVAVPSSDRHHDGGLAA